MPSSAFLVALVAVILGALLVRFDHERGFERVSAIPAESASDETDAHVRHTVWFPSHGTNCHAWLFLPKRPATRAEGSDATGAVFPLVIMGSGLGGQKDFGIVPYARMFVKTVYFYLLLQWSVAVSPHQP